jgi:hypothetical protein
MNTYKDFFKNTPILFGVVIGIAWVISSFVLARGFSLINTHNAISVTGTSERIVESDAAKWTLTLSKQAVPEAYSFASKQLKEGEVVLTRTLVSRGIQAQAITVQPLVSTVLCQSQNQVMYDGAGRQQCSGPFTYNLTQTIIVESENVSLVKDLSLNAVSSFTVPGIQMQTLAVDYFYTKLADIRAVLLEEASKNAKERANAIAKSTGNRIGSVKDASQGIFQVTQKNSTDVSDYGSYDTSTIEKKVTAIVRASFEVK